MRIIDGDTSRSIYFVAVDSLDFVTRETGLTGFSVYYSLDGGTATAMTTPSITELDSTNMPGVYALAIDEAAMVTLGTGVESAELALTITCAGMAQIDRVVAVQKGIADTVTAVSAIVPTAEENAAAVIAEELGFTGDTDRTLGNAIQDVWAATVGSVSFDGSEGSYKEPDGTTEKFTHTVDDTERPTLRVLTLPD